MGLSDDSDDNTNQRFENLCLDLNMDKTAKDEAWQLFERISLNYTLEGDSIHWLACALYVSCRRSVVPTVGKGVMEGNCVSLTRLLRSAKLSLIEFFKKMKKWSDMANLPQEFRDKIDRLERNFAVSTVIFKKFEPIFLSIFQNPEDDPPKVPRSRKQRRLPCTVSDVFNFGWTMFVQVKGNFVAISDDLVNSYHLLLCCIDWFYANALLSNRKDLLNPSFEGLPPGFSSREFRPPSEVPCIIQLLCEKHEGLLIEAKCIKEHWWKPHVKKLFEKNTLRGKLENLTGVLDLGNFETNSKEINKAYEEFVLNVGDFDERIFLGKDAAVEMGTPIKSGTSAAVGEISERMQVSRNLHQHFEETNTLTPSTPLTGRRYLKDKEPVKITPVSTATQGVSKLQSLLAGRKTTPTDALLEIFGQCKKNPNDNIVERVKQMGETFCAKYTQPAEDQLGSNIDFARRRLQLGEGLYYKIMENILVAESKRAVGRDPKTIDFSSLLEQDTFHRSLFACCLEIVIFSYNSQRMFPWIIEVFDLNPYYFYKVIEIIIRAEENLSRDVVKHLNHIEELILEQLAWKPDSAVWDAIKEHEGAGIPSVEEVSLPNQIEKDGAPNATSSSASQPMNPAIRRLTGPAPGARKDLTLSPTGPIVSLSDRFGSPDPGTARRKLFVQTSPGAGSAAAAKTTPVPVVKPAQQATTYVAFQPKMEAGRQVLVPVNVVTAPSIADTASGSQQAEPKQAEPKQSSQPKPKKTGSLALFFRKVYHLSSVRLRDLCERLDIDNETRSQIWTCFEHCLIHHTEVLKDRHLDQLIMCAIYILAKVTGKDKSFQDIMRCYRLQPQAQSHVYRSVLLSSRKRRTSGDSDSSKNATSGTNSPVEGGKDEKEVERKRALSSLIRSSSTLPVPLPNSQPPTPTRLAGTGSTFEFEDRGEDRGDIIKFYNMIFVPKKKKVPTATLR